MTPKPSSERSWLILAAIVLVAIVLLTRWSHRIARTGSSPSATAQPSFIPVPSDPPTPASIAELQTRNPTLHWAAVDARTVMIVTTGGACGTLTGLAPAQISFHTGRDYDRDPHLFSSWSDAYTAAERYCLTWASAAKARPPAP